MILVVIALVVVFILVATRIGDRNPEPVTLNAVVVPVLILLVCGVVLWPFLALLLNPVIHVLVGR